MIRLWRAATAATSSQYVLLSAARFKSNRRASQEGICTATYPRLAAQAQIASKELKGALSDANCARNMPGPRIVFMAMPPSFPAIRLVGRNPSGSYDVREGFYRYAGQNRHSIFERADLGRNEARKTLFFV